MICGRVDWLKHSTNYKLWLPITCWFPILSFTHLALSVGGEEAQKVSEWSRLHAYLWGGESYWESFHGEPCSWDHSSSQHQVRHLWEDTRHQEDTRGNLMPGVQSAGVEGKAKTSQRPHWYIVAEVTNQSIWCHKHISLPRTSLIWMLQDVKMTNGEILALIKEIIWNQLYINIYWLVRDDAGGGTELAKLVFSIGRQHLICLK